MTTALTSSLALLFLALAPLPTHKTTKPLPKHTVAPKVNPAVTPAATKKQPSKTPAKAPTKVQPGKTVQPQVQLDPERLKFKRLPPLKRLRRDAKKKKIVPADGPSALTELARLSAGNARDGDFTIDFRCAFVLTYPSVGPNGYAMWPHRVLDFCRRQGTDGMQPGVTISFPVVAGQAYAVDCNSHASTRFHLRHKVGSGAWSAKSTVTTANPTEFVLARTSGEAQVRVDFDPVHNHILNQAIRYCRVSRVG